MTGAPSWFDCGKDIEERRVDEASGDERVADLTVM
jgi:hypothetical protein